jgi:hypothetical protein
VTRDRARHKWHRVAGVVVMKKTTPRARRPLPCTRPEGVRPARRASDGKRHRPRGGRWQISSTLEGPALYALAVAVATILVAVARSL